VDSVSNYDELDVASSRYPPRVPKIAPTSASAEFIEDRGLMSRAREDLERSMGSRKVDARAAKPLRLLRAQTGSEAVSLSARMTRIESREKQEGARRFPSREESNARGRLGVEAEKSDGALFVHVICRCRETASVIRER
jgi:hypothetical protein